MPARRNKESKGRKRRISFDSSDEEFNIQDISTNDEVPEVVPQNVENQEIDKVQDSFGGLNSMTAEEMSQHLKLCMKLSAENKINMKNAFGLHLIEIMRKMVKNTGRADIQQASLSLQASSKIYAGRVEALYQETCRFHGHLQSILSGGKKEKKKQNVEDFEEGVEEDDTERKKSRPQRKAKCFLKSEESLSIESEINALSSGEPHGNFVTINSCFNTSRLAPKLLSSLRLVNDSCMLRCAIPESCYKPQNPLQNEPFVVPPKLEGNLEKIKNINISEAEFQALSTSEINFSFQTPQPAPMPMLHDESMDHFDPGQPDDSVMPPPDNPDLMEGSIDRFDVLNITVAAFVNDISAAVTKEGVDHNLLPPNSALKRMLDKSKRNSIRPSVGKSTRKKVKEPFFNGRSADNIKHLFVKGRANTISEKLLSEWNVQSTSNIDLGYEFIEDLDVRNSSEKGLSFMKADQVFDIIKQNDLQYYFKYYFCKESQLWKLSRRKMCLDLSFPGTPFGNKTERNVGSLAPNEPEALAISFQNLSLHESMHEFPAADEGLNSSDYEAPAFVDAEEPQYLVNPEPFEMDIEEMMVKPPELVRPTIMKFDQRPVNLNTEKIKLLLWAIISKRLENNNHIDEKTSEPFVLFSEVYEELKHKLKKEISEFISMQFAFVVLLILANQKTLLIENFKENTDLSIKQDISEIDTSQSQ